MSTGFDWWSYAEQSTTRFIERFADLSASECPDKATEIAEAKRLKAIRDGMESYNKKIDEMVNEMRQIILNNPVLNCFGIDASSDRRMRP
jgi:hypothetical protein